MSQNLFRQFLYVSTSSFYNWVSINAKRDSRGWTLHRSGPALARRFGHIEFTVGRPWGARLLTGYTVRDLLFHPLIEEYFNTSSYVGLQHKFGSRLTAAILAEDLRSWRVQNTDYAIAQALLAGRAIRIPRQPALERARLIPALARRRLSRIRQRAERIPGFLYARFPRQLQRWQQRPCGVSVPFLPRSSTTNFL
jgi:hypothetical protein